MRVVVITKDQTDYAREVSDYVFEFERRTGHELEILDPESREGISFTTTYDILEFPTIVALSESSQMLNMWKGRPLPTISDLSYYTC